MSKSKNAQDEIFKEILRKFQCERNRLAEESFARTFSETQETKLFFINEDAAYTDGKNIIVDPAIMDIYKDEECLKKTEDAMGLPNLIKDSPWNALKMVTRGLTLHECLHLIYTDFPGRMWNDSELDSNNKRKVAADISNIIEDAYIEAVAASIYDNIALYLMFNRYAFSFANARGEGRLCGKFSFLSQAAAKRSREKFFSPPKGEVNSFAPSAKIAAFFTSLFEDKRKRRRREPAPLQ